MCWKMLSGRGLAQARRPLSLVAADEGKLGVKVYHTLNLGLLGLTPVALLVPSQANFLLDMALAVAFPLHGHIGMNYVITDYVPKFFGKAARGPARIAMLGESQRNPPPPFALVAADPTTLRATELYLSMGKTTTRAGVTSVTTLGLFKLNIQGPGITKTLKACVHVKEGLQRRAERQNALSQALDQALRACRAASRRVGARRLGRCRGAPCLPALGRCLKVTATFLERQGEGKRGRDSPRRVRGAPLGTARHGKSIRRQAMREFASG